MPENEVREMLYLLTVSYTHLSSEGSAPPNGTDRSGQEHRSRTHQHGNKYQQRFQEAAQAEEHRIAFSIVALMMPAADLVCNLYQWLVLINAKLFQHFCTDEMCIRDRYYYAAGT